MTNELRAALATLARLNEQAGLKPLSAILTRAAILEMDLELGALLAEHANGIGTGIVYDRAEQRHRPILITAEVA